MESELASSLQHVDGGTGPYPKAVLDCLFLPGLVSPLFPQLTTAWICPLEFWEDHEVSSYNQRNGGPRKALAQDPTVSQLIWGFKFMLGMEEKKNNFPCTLRSWLRPPCKKTDWPIYICLLICISHGYRKDTQEKLPNPQITQATTLNTIFS